MIKPLKTSSASSLYHINDKEKRTLERYIVSTKETRKICNDPFVCGVEYTRLLQKACASAFKDLTESGSISLNEREAIVFNVLRGGLNFGLREALADAFGWNLHGSSFISAQRARNDDNSENWHIVESDYRKVYMPEKADIIIGDVVATGTSLQHALDALLKEAREQGVMLNSILFFTFGGIRAEEILDEVDKTCRKIFPEYQGTSLIYIEGRFTVPQKDTPLSIRITGTDLLKLDALMAPEFIESQYESASYPLERCIIYDAGSRAFWLPEYLEDVRMYWKQTLGLATAGTDFKQLCGERFPELDVSRYGDADLVKICKKHIAKLDELI